MAPKKKDNADPFAGLPPIEDEVEWPEDIEALPDPGFKLALTLVYSHEFQVEAKDGEDVSAATGAAPKAKAKAKPKAAGKDSKVPEPAASPEGLPALVPFNPCSQLRESLKDPPPEGKNAPPVDIWAKRAIVVDREELIPLGGEGGSVAKGLQARLDREKAARARHKVNAFRKSVISGGAAGRAAAVAAAQEAAAAGATGASIDFFIILMDFPTSLEEVQALQEEGALDLADTWLAVYFAGQTCVDEESEGPVSLEMGIDESIKRVKKACETPTVLHDIFTAVQAATVGTALSRGAIRTVLDSQLLRKPVMLMTTTPSPAPPPPQPEAGAEGEGGEAGEETEPRPVTPPPPSIYEVVTRLLTEEAKQHSAFQEWLDGREVVSIPSPPPDEKPRLTCYEQMFDLIPAEQQDIPMLLHCLCEQVERTFEEKRVPPPDQQQAAGNEEGLPAEASGFNRQTSASGSLHGGGTRISSQKGVTSTSEDIGQRRSSGAGSAGLGSLLGGSGVASYQESPAHRPEEDTDSTLLYFLDYAACRHLGTVLPGEIAAADEVQKLLSHIQGPGLRRHGLPPEPDESAAQGSAARNRLYPFALDVPTLELERLLMLQEFETLMQKCCPEQDCSFGDRVFHERIPKDLLCQVLFQAFSEGRFMDTVYVKRHDSLLLALYHRALPGQGMWHLWSGDHLAKPASSKPPPTTMPSYNDWLRLASKRELLYGIEPGAVDVEELDRIISWHSSGEGSNSQKERGQLIDLDARQFGYSRQIEKLLTPADGSVIWQIVSHRGLAEAIAPPGPTSAVSPQEEELDPDPEPQYATRTSFVQKDGMIFGITTDVAWAERVRVFREEREAREKKEREEAEAAAAAEAEAKAAAEKLDGLRRGMGMEVDEQVELEDIKPEVDEAPKSLTEMHLEQLRLGVLWISFKDGARCTMRVHHERPWFPPEATVFDTLVAQPGMLFTYILPSGLVIQVFGNGAVRQCHAMGVLGGFGWIDLVPHSTARAWPGDLDDVQVCRTITPFGTLVIELLSGRQEIYHADGTRAFRNPTLEELYAKLEEYRLSSNLQGVSLLEKFVLTYEMEFSEPMMFPPSQEAKHRGLPGHWRISRPDGRVFGRVPMPPPPPPGPTEEELAKMEEERLAAEAAERAAAEEAAAAAAAAKKGGKKKGAPSPDPAADAGKKSPPPDAKAGAKKKAAKSGAPTPEPVQAAAEDDEAAAEEEEAPEPPVPTIDQLIEGIVVDDGATLEYQIGEGVDATLAIDPHTGQLINMHSENMLRFSHEKDTKHVNICADQTRMSRQLQEDGSLITVIEKAGLATTTCLTQKPSSQTSLTPMPEKEAEASLVGTTTVKINCPDGAEIEVKPKKLEAGELLPWCWAPQEPSMDAGLSTNASVTLRRREGVVVTSKGAGEVELTSGVEAPSRDHGMTIKSLDGAMESLSYTAKCHEDRIVLKDTAGSEFELRGDQTSHVSPAGVVARAADVKDEEDGETAPPPQSPRCLRPQVPYGQPELADKPPPQGLPAARLFVIYGDGEAEELLLTRDVQEVLRLAKQDPACSVVEGEPMGPPMETCRSYSIFKTLEPPTQPCLEPLKMPPIIEHRQRAMTYLRPPQPSCTYMQWRHFVEYPPVTQKRRTQFRNALARYKEWEEQFQKENCTGKGVVAGQRGW